MVQAVSRRLPNAETWVRARISLCGIRDRQSGRGTGFFPSSSCFSSRYHSYVALHIHISSPDVSANTLWWGRRCWTNSLLRHSWRFARFLPIFLTDLITIINGGGRINVCIILGGRSITEFEEPCLKAFVCEAGSNCLCIPFICNLTEHPLTLCSFRRGPQVVYLHMMWCWRNPNRLNGQQMSSAAGCHWLLRVLPKKRIGTGCIKSC